MVPLELLQKLHFACGSRLPLGGTGHSSESALASLLSPPRQHHRVNVEGCRHRLYFHARELCQPDRSQLELKAVTRQPLGTETCGHQTLLSCYAEVSTLSRQVPSSAASCCSAACHFRGPMTDLKRRVAGR